MLYLRERRTHIFVISELTCYYLQLPWTDEVNVDAQNAIERSGFHAYRETVQAAFEDFYTIKTNLCSFRSAWDWVNTGYCYATQEGVRKQCRLQFLILVLIVLTELQIVTAYLVSMYTSTSFDIKWVDVRRLHSPSVIQPSVGFMKLYYLLIVTQEI
jgi:hypothetical protein